MSSTYFVTGTDTEIGKTWSCVALMNHWRQQGLNVAALKPVAAGGEQIDGEYRNEDALLLQRASSIELAYRDINRYAFSQAVSPHIACNGVDIVIDLIQEDVERLKARCDKVLVEGAGGWLSPLDRVQTNQSLACALGLPVILVVGVRLGCINHALLTARAIRAAHLTLAGWIAVQLQPEMPGFDANLDYLREHLPADYLGCLQFMPSLAIDDVGNYFRVEKVVILT